MRYLFAVILLITGVWIVFASSELAATAPVTAVMYVYWGVIVVGAGIVIAMYEHYKNAKKH